MKAEEFYKQYSAEDYILDERFQDWVMQGNDDEFWQAFRRKYPEKTEMIRAARAFIQNLQFREHVPDRLLEQKSLERFRERTPDLLERPEDTRRRTLTKGGTIGFRFLRGVAASVLVLCLLGGTSWLLFKKNPVRVETAYGQMKQIKLPDNSVVYLNANSSLLYEESVLGDFSREVWLTGEAFFQVEKQSDMQDGYRKFLVHTDGMGVEVLGTTFNVRDRHAISSVTLQTGKVLVNMNEGEQVMLQPGERVEIDRQDQQVVKNKVKTERYTSWRNLRYTFDQTPVSELVQIIGDNYGLDVVIEDKKIADGKLSGVLEADNLQTFVNAVSFALNITIKKDGKQLIFEPKRK